MKTGEESGVNVLNAVSYAPCEAVLPFRVCLPVDFAPRPSKYHYHQDYRE